MRISDWSSDVCSSDLALVVYCRAQSRTQRGVHHRPLQHDCNDQANHDQEQTVDTHVQTRQMELARKEFRKMQWLLLRTKEIMCAGNGHEHQTNQEQHLIEQIGRAHV